MEERIKKIVSDTFLILLLAYIAGVATSSIADAGFYFALFIFIIAGGFLMCRFIFAGEISKKFFTFLFFGALIFACGSLRYAAKDFHTLPQELVSKPRNVELELVVVEEPKDKGSYIQYVAKSREYDEKFIIRAERNPRFRYGDLVTFSGALSRTESFEDERGRVVPYDEILAARDVYFVISRATGEKISENEASKFRYILFNFKSKFLEKVRASLPEPHSTLVTGIVFGSDDTLGEKDDDAFRAAGITHIIVLSGYNLTIVATIILATLTFLPLGGRAVTASIVIVLFALMAGGGASVFRACLMAVMALVARAGGRRYLAGRMLVLAATIMLIINPKVLVFDLGFQLSFLATGALIWLAPFIEKKLQRIPERFGFREVVSTSIAAHMTVMPLLLYSIGNVSPFGVFANIVILGVVPFIMGLGVLLGAVGFAGTLVAFPITAIAWLLSSYVIFVARLFAKIPYANAPSSLFLLAILSIVYVAFIFWIFPQAKTAYQFFINKNRG